MAGANSQPFTPPEEKLDEQALRGGQGFIFIADAPAGAAGFIGKTLIDAGQLNVLGTYKCLVPLAGMVSRVDLFLKATFASGTVTTTFDTLYYVKDRKDPSSWTAKTGATDEGAMTTTVLQDCYIDTLRGEQWGLLTIVLGTAAACTFTQGEYCGT